MKPGDTVEILAGKYRGRRGRIVGGYGHLLRVKLNGMTVTVIKGVYAAVKDENLKLLAESPNAKDHNASR